MDDGIATGGEVGVILERLHPILVYAMFSSSIIAPILKEAEFWNVGMWMPP